MRVLLGMSGGVDSTVAAHLLIKAGWEVVGVNLQLTGEKSERAQKCADALGIEFYCEDMRAEFDSLVKTPFARKYIEGKTPNPCVTCNKYIKFGLMAELTEKYNCEKLATGHYVKSEFSQEYGKVVLKKAEDIKKDQSYFLWQLDKSILEKTIFPLGGYTKEQIRNIASEENLPCADSPDSQDVCFVTDGDCAGFIEAFTGKKAEKGAFIDINGSFLGEHKGITAYTVGQRKGLGISAEHPLYVLSKNIHDNTVVLGKNEELFYDKVILEEVNIQAVDNMPESMPVDAKIRYSTKTAEGILSVCGDTAVLSFKERQRAPSPGQSAVFYVGDTMIGGGIIKDYK